MKRTSRIMLLALGFGLVPVIFFFHAPSNSEGTVDNCGFYGQFTDLRVPQFFRFSLMC